MPTQEDTGIPIFSAPDGRGYRLLELPPELESLLDSPTAPVLYLKQPDDATSAQLSVDGGQTYALQQKNTSNALFLLAPTASIDAPPSEDPSDEPTEGGMTILATLHETIELIVQAPTQQQKAKGKWHERFGRNR
ncbi:hypothetical protein B0T11DRAFT_278521 [Plectosphaerella cucumerina]|uniref:Sister chromatid cohesion protein DCC1 n=1 Tax=Plectosphaerella cucumerina TaxID=40658 RepID=A0A8K0TKQ8_9PEZI|nr:hypothetical protein B0T11DRAFT_278521 [Plectosphaerella cucumerina]